MSMEMTIDLVEEGTLSQTYSGNRVIVRATRVASVSGLDDGSHNAAATALARAMRFVAARFPLYSLYPGAACVVTGHEALGIFDDLAKIRVVYDTPDVAPGSTLTISDTTSTVRDTSQIVRDDQGKIVKQVVVSYGDANGNSPPTVADFTCDRTLRHIVMEGNIKAKDLSPFRAAVNHVNQDAWYGLPPGFWKFDVFQDTTRDSGKTYDVHLECRADINRDQSVYVVAKNRNNGQYVTIKPSLLQAIQGFAYSPFDVLEGNGIVRVCPYGWTSFVNIFGPERST